MTFPSMATTMRTLLTALLFPALVPALAQDAALYLVPRWKVGDTRTMAITTMTNSTENGEATAERDYMEGRVRVVNETPQAFILRIEYDNVVLRQAAKLGAALGEDPQTPAKLTLRYTVDRLTGKSALENWEEVQRTVKKSFADVKKQVTAKDSSLAPAFQLVMTPILGLFDKRENVEAYFHDAIDPITSCFGQDFRERDTLRTVEYGASPFGGPDSIRTTTRIWLERVDRMEQQAFINTLMVLDMEPLVRMMKQMAAGFMDPAKMSAEERRKAQKKMDQELAAMKFDARYQGTHIIDLRSNWPISVVTTANLVSSAPGKNAVTKVVRTVRFTP